MVPEPDIAETGVASQSAPPSSQDLGLDDPFYSDELSRTPEAAPMSEEPAREAPAPKGEPTQRAAPPAQPEPAADGLSCKVTAIGPITDIVSTITFTADADLGAGVVPLIGTAECTRVTPGTATVVTLNVGAPQEQP